MLLKGGTYSHQFVHNDVICGHVDIRFPGDGLRTRTHQGFVEIWCFGIEQSLQNQGLGKKMMADVIEEARSTGHKKLWLNVHKDNIRAQKVYVQSGFSIARDNGYGSYEMTLEIN